MQARFVILFHSGNGQDHYDLMIETGERLATWQFLSFPAAGAICRQLPPHRKAYLTYQGHVSNRRGEVTRIDKGFCEPAETADGLRVSLRGKKIAGEFLLSKIAGDEWSFNIAS
ncbi:MAG TPA: hypothetical protein PKK48_02390 [Phycisphaerae bacterium]|nr:hypothetical protein [Phycisphaerae bacterium]HPS51924.1 hypothetical protein [Phycisphaerae bacterium]